MPRWRVYGVVTATKYLGEYEAETMEKAEEMALESDAASVCLCNACNRQAEDAEIHSAGAEPIES